MPKKETKIFCVKGKQHDTEVFSALLSIDDIKKHIQIDYFSKDTEKVSPSENGYQRKRDKAKITEYAAELINPDTICPNAIWINDRDDKALFNPISKRNPSIGYLSIPHDAVFHAPDGGLRIASLIESLEMDENMNDLFEMPVVITLAPKSVEERGFIDINDKSEKVKPVHKASIKYSMALKDGYNALKGQHERYEALAYGTVNRIDTDKSSSLFDMFVAGKLKPRYTARDKKVAPYKSNRRVIQMGTFNSSLVKSGCIKFFETHFFNDIEHIERKSFELADYLNNYWSEVRKLTIEMWGSPKEYAFFDAIGSIFGNYLFFYLSREMYYAGEDLTSENYAKYLEKISILKKHTAWYNTRGVKVNNFINIAETMFDKRGSSKGKDIADEEFNKLAKTFGFTPIAIKKKSVTIGLAKKAAK